MGIMRDFVEVVGQQKMRDNSQYLMALRNPHGFSLTELLITVAIVGILISFGYPAYTGQLATAARAAAQSDLMAMAAGMERHKAATFTYSGAASGGGNTGSPGFFNNWSPSTEPVANKKYNLSINSVSASGISYVLTATPISGTSSAGDGTIYYYSDGRKAWDNNDDGSLASSEYCWVC